ncbi:MAG: fibronectin type III domain-containing protein [Bacteroidota bacterium]
MKKIIALFFILVGLIAVLTGSLHAQINPYLQTPTPTSVYISWHSNDTSFTKIRYGLSDINLEQVKAGSFQNISGKHWHTVKLNGLTPDTRYYYRCISGNDSSSVYPFRSQPLPGTAGRHIRFVIFGDSRYNDTIESILGPLCQNVQQTLQSKYGETWFDSVNMVMHTGDIVWNGKDINRFENEYFSKIANLSCTLPFMISIGNHEHESAFYFDYMKYEDFTDSAVARTSYKERFYSFEIAGCKFVVLNSNDKIIGAPIQKTWLNKVLTESEADPGTNLVFTFAHHPWQSEVWTEGDHDSVDVVFYPEFLKFNKMVQYSYGHAHDFELGSIVNTSNTDPLVHDFRTVLAGGGGAELTRFFSGSIDYPEIQETVDDYNYVIMDVNVDDRSYVAEAYTLGKPERPLHQVLETWHFRMNQAPPQKPVANPVTTTNPVILSASAMSGADSCMSSWFEVTGSQGNYSSPLLSKLRDKEDIFENTGSPNFIPINKNIGIDLTSLELPDSITTQGKTLWYRVKYRDDNLKWSQWSDEVAFNNTGIDEPDFSSDKFKLLQNYPNPFRASTEVGYKLKSKAHVSITVLNMFGEEVATLVNEEKPAGEYSVIFTVSEDCYPAGIYFVSMRCDDTFRNRKMIIAY